MSTNRLQQTFARLQQSGHKALIPYFCAGDPDLHQSASIMHAAVAAGAHVIELGIPFSDPAADGITIQQAHERALARGVRFADVLQVVRDFRTQDTHTPVVLMGYLNSIERHGADKALSEIAAAGVDGLILVDCPLEALPDYEALFAQYELAPILLVAPTTNPERLAQISAKAQGFLYFIALKGVTGAQTAHIDTIATHVAQCRALSPVPVCIGFGIKDGQSAVQMSQHADGVVIGSAFVAHLYHATQNKQDLAQSAFTFIHAISQSLNPKER